MPELNSYEPPRDATKGPAAFVSPAPIDHPVVRSAKREAVLVLVLWAIACTFTVGYCFFRGFGGSLATTTFIFGFPEWVFVGIVAPWIFWSVVSTIVANWVITDDDLGEEVDVEEPRP